MKIYIIGLLLLFLNHDTKSEVNINLEIQSGDDESVLYYTPSNGEFNLLSQTLEKTNKNGKLDISLNIKQNGFVYIFPQLDYKNDDWHAIQLYVEPDSHISISLNKSRPSSSMVITGSNAPIQYFLNNRERHFLLYLSNSSKTEKMYIDNDPDKTIIELDALKNEELEILRQIDNVEDEILEFIQADINCYYKEAFYSILLKFGDIEDENEWKIKDNWMKTLKDNSNYTVPEENSNSSLWYESNLNLKRNYLKQEYKSTFKEQFEHLDDLEKEWRILNHIFTKKELRIYTSNNLYYDMHKNQFDEKTLFEYAKFKKEYSESPYFEILSAPFEKQLDFQSSSDSQIFIEKTSVNTLKEVCNLQDTDLIFVDLWATWCGPCIKEFSLDDSLKQYISNRSEISMIYITLDENKPIDEIEKVINFHQLDGLHILANAKLKNELEQKLGNSGNLSLPSYALLNKSGEILIKNASRPSNWKKLRSELKSNISL